MTSTRHDVNAKFWARVRSGETDECWPWTAGKSTYGYGWTRWGRGTCNAHRVAWTLTRGPIPPGLCVLHRCDNRPCCNPAHLFLGTNADNNADRDAKGRGRGASGDSNGSRTHPERRARGDRHGSRTHPDGWGGRRKLTESFVRDIRARLLAGETKSAIAKKYGVGHTTIHRISRGELWRHVS